LKDSLVFEIHTEHLGSLSGRPLGYWLSEQMLLRLGTMPTAKEAGVEVRIGLQTSNDFRYLRNWWEVRPTETTWIPFSKGGDFSPYFDDIHLVVFWQNNGATYWTPINAKLGKPVSNIWMLGETISRYFGQGGLTYPRRTSKKFNPRVLPSGCAFSDKAPVIRWGERSRELAFLSLSS
jgi:hypothetical protein